MNKEKVNTLSAAANDGYSFDFDVWAALAKSDPAEFERQRDQAVQVACETMGGLKQPAIARICWRIEQERKLSKSPLQLCLSLSAMMWERYYNMADAMNTPLLWQKFNELQKLTQECDANARMTRGH